MRRIRTGVAAAAVVVAAGVLALPAVAGAETPKTPAPVTPKSLVYDLVGTLAQPVGTIGDSVVSAGGTTMSQEEVIEAIYGWYQTQPH